MQRQTLQEFSTRYSAYRWTKNAQRSLDTGYKLCRKCGETKPVEDFSGLVTPYKTLRLASYCRPCARSYKSKLSAEEKAEKSRRSYYRNHEKNKERARLAWYRKHEENKARLRERYADRRQENIREILDQDVCDICGEDGALHFYRCINAQGLQDSEFSLYLVLHKRCEKKAKEEDYIPCSGKVREKRSLL